MTEHVVCYRYRNHAPKVYDYFFSMFRESEVDGKWDNGEETLEFEPNIKITMINTSLGSFIKEVFVDDLKFIFEWDSHKVGAFLVYPCGSKMTPEMLDAELMRFILTIP